MNFKKVVIVAATVGVFFSAGLGVKSLAENFWAGHTDVETINSSIDTLTSRIQEKKQNVVTLTNELGQARIAVSNFNDQLNIARQQLEQANHDKETQLQQKVDEINQRISEGNQRVAEKQREVDAANQTINSLNQQISTLQNQVQNNNNQALSDVQATRSKAVQAVQQTADSSDSAISK
ncbi:hypothetical protein P7H71_00185 [Lactococcus lactis]|uniref:Uncharacterized protein n=1 Tax=Lactococcus lactis TaxID=1358 RepID=A0AAP5UAY7_9LACT|nr:hypothetical protein [Lactococcus lactis]MDT2860214.1 hypothetical protein [Lactococcus lactis]MDT2862531.1 hypothetical protein [Lactococcus lactis]MDT2868128.1 hypothetical protein [Lactococcus lactis]MDT2869264.1 hypothetical protein [Lactococcus lactis]MDT2872884.1 hypothetical protein [Lactococcus lactis]